MIKNIKNVLVAVIVTVFCGTALLFSALLYDSGSAAVVFDGVLPVCAGLYVLWLRQQAAQVEAENNDRIVRFREQAEAHGRAVQQGRELVARAEEQDRRIRSLTARHDTAKQRVALLEEQLAASGIRLAGEKVK